MKSKDHFDFTNNHRDRENNLSCSTEFHRKIFSEHHKYFSIFILLIFLIPVVGYSQIVTKTEYLFIPWGASNTSIPLGKKNFIKTPTGIRAVTYLCSIKFFKVDEQNDIYFYVYDYKDDYLIRYDSNFRVVKKVDAPFQIDDMVFENNNLVLTNEYSNRIYYCSKNLNIIKMFDIQRSEFDLYHKPIIESGRLYHKYYNKNEEKTAYVFDKDIININKEPKRLMNRCIVKYVNKKKHFYSLKSERVLEVNIRDKENKWSSVPIKFDTSNIYKTFLLNIDNRGLIYLQNTLSQRINYTTGKAPTSLLVIDMYGKVIYQEMFDKPEYLNASYRSLTDQIQVNEEGNIYQLVTTEAGAKVFRWQVKY